jgi:hypothetical protein
VHRGLLIRKFLWTKRWRDSGRSGHRLRGQSQVQSPALKRRCERTVVLWLQRVAVCRTRLSDTVWGRLGRRRATIL